MTGERRAAGERYLVAGRDMEHETASVSTKCDGINQSQEEEEGGMKMRNRRETDRHTGSGNERRMKRARM